MQSARFLILLAFLFGLSAAPSSAYAKNPGLEYEVKLAYLYKFTHYVRWHKNVFPSSRSPIVIGVLGEDPFGPLLDELARQKGPGNRPIRVHRFEDWSTYQPCHILFVSRNADAKLRALAVRKTKATPVLIVGEIDDYTRQGATAAFYLDGRRTVGIEFNVHNLEERGLHIDARLLKISRIVK